MKKKLLLLFATLLLMGSLLLLSSCAMTDLDKAMKAAGAGATGEEYTVSIRFDASGGSLRSGNEGKVAVIEIYNAEGGDFKIPAPEDASKRGNYTLNATKTGYFLAGWYRERHETIAPTGEVTYTYSGKWDFENDIVEVDPNKEYDPNVPVMTLYAAWIPEYNYEFYAVDEYGEATLIGSKQLEDLVIPQWNVQISNNGAVSGDGTMRYNDFLTRDGYTFDGAYLDAALTQKVEEKIDGSDYVNFENGTAKTDTIKIYSKWLKGTWYKIYTADQFISNSALNGNYLICRDLDFAGKNWNGSTMLSAGTFTGKIVAENGNTYKFSNISFAQGAEKSRTTWGLFGILSENATIENIHFENVTFDINLSYQLQFPTSFGLLAGQNYDATLTNVTVSGTIRFCDKVYSKNLEEDLYQFHLLTGNGNTAGIDFSNISCVTNDLCDVVPIPESNGTITLQSEQIKEENKE